MKKIAKKIKKKAKKAIRIIEEYETFFNSFSFRLFLIFSFAISMAFLEAVVVVYLREMFALYYLKELQPEKVEFALKLPYFALIKNPFVIVPSLRILIIEIFREAATIVMLFTFAFLVGRKLYQRAAIFFLSFGIWDIFYYIFLYLMIGWPPSLTTVDVLFLIPLPWLAPVWLPVGISVVWIVASLYVLIKRNEKRK